ncbi:hypothetical protein C8R46DRAFT_1233414 [Mycena filopes]|nr:hypothetical protein C8R46DRAFT_1233414 [Mycena filopes]
MTSAILLADLIRCVPPLTKKKLDPKGIIRKLRMNDSAREAALQHIEAMGMDTLRFSNSSADQDRAFQAFTDFSLHLPNEINRDARSKLVIVTSLRDSCGADHTSGRLREMAWENVECGCWFRITTTHYEPSKDISTHVLLTIDEILGDFTHSAVCLETDIMDRNPRIPLHPLIREHTLSLLRKNIPLAQLRQQCREFSHARWGVQVGAASHRYVLTDYESTSLYRTIARESGIPQRSTAQDNLHLWFNKDKPQPPDPRLSAACVAYSPYIPGETERFSIILMTPEQKLLAWKFGHRRQVLMDLTFGVCNSEEAPRQRRASASEIAGGLGGRRPPSVGWP